VPFNLLGDSEPNWLVLERTDRVVVPIEGIARHLVFAWFCDPLPRSRATRGEELLAESAALGQELGAVTLRFADGDTASRPIRRRIEIAPPRVEWGMLPAAARTHLGDRVIPDAGPYPREKWGRYQIGNDQEAYRDRSNLWLWVLENPRPDSQLRAIELEATSGLMAIAGITLSTANSDPLAFTSRWSLKVTPPVPAEAFASIDRGWIVQSADAVDVSAAQWQGDVLRGFGSSGPISSVLDVTAHPDAVAVLAGIPVPLRELEAQRELAIKGRRVVSLPDAIVPIEVSVVADGKAVASRVHIHGEDGRQWAPIQQRVRPNTRWFEDDGSDVVLQGWRYFYVDGPFRILAPPGQLFLEVWHGPEFKVHRRTVEVSGTRKRIIVRLERIADLRAEGWVSADTHVHFMSPSAAHLHARAESVHIVNLLAIQWGELFANLAELRAGSRSISSDDAIVRIGSENRHHALGHMLALGSSHTWPLSSGGPAESRFGDPDWVSIASWAETARSDGGAAVLGHFPDPYLEAAVDILLGRVDAVEMWFDPAVDSYRMQEWYRYLNLGVRLPLVAGSDKMSANGVLGSIRTVARVLDGEARELNFDAWLSALRSGRTYVTTGPLLDFDVDGARPGGVIRGRGPVQAAWRIRSVLPVARLQIVANGAVVFERKLTQRTGEEGSIALTIPRVGWIAARCDAPAVIRELPRDLQVGAHTSPIYFRRRKLPSPADVASVEARLDAVSAWSAHLARWSDEVARRQFDAMIDKARGQLRALEGLRR